MASKTTTVRGELDMAYETKVLLIALAKIVRKADNIEEIYEALEEMANAEGVILKSYNDTQSENQNI